MPPKIFKLGFCNMLESVGETGNVWKAVIIEEGMSKNGQYYTRKALQDAVPLFEGSNVCFYEFKQPDGKNMFNHLPTSVEKIRPEGFPLQIAGVIKDAKFETLNIEGREVSGITGCIHLVENDVVKPLKDLLCSAWKQGMKRILGLSINANGESMLKMLNGIPVRVVQAIKNVFSTDFVTQPAAGGCLINLIESINNTEEGDLKMFEKLIAALKSFVPKMFESVDVKNVTEEQLVGLIEGLKAQADMKAFAEAVATLVKEKKIDEAVKLVESKMTPAAAPAAAAAPGKEAKQSEDTSAILKASADLKVAQDKLAKDMETFNRNIKLRESAEMLEEQLAMSKLPIPFRNKIRASFKEQVLELTTIKEAIKIEKDALAAVVGSSSSLEIGDGQVVDFEVRGSGDRLQASMDLMFDPQVAASEKDKYKDVEAFGSIREAYVAFTDDPEVNFRMGPKAQQRLREATDASFTYALGYSMNRRMIKDYKAVPDMWRQLANVTTAKDFKMKEVIQWGGFGILPTVQAARTVAGTPIDSATPSYPELGFPGDAEASYAVATKGGMITVTRRMIIDDDLRILGKLPGKAGQAAARTLNQFVFDLMLNMSAGTINGGTIYDSLALYVAAHGNYQTDAFGVDALQSLLNLLWYQYEKGNATAVTDNPLTVGATTLNVTGGTGDFFKANDIASIEGELVRISSVATDALTIVRGQYGTTAAQHSQNAVVTKVTRFLGTEKPNLWVPRALYAQALAISGSDKNPENAENAINVLKGLFTLQPACPYLQGDENNYYVTATTSDMEFIEVAFLNGQEEPEILVQEDPLAGNVFQYDTIRYKIRHEYGGAVVDHKAAAASIVS